VPSEIDRIQTNTDRTARLAQSCLVDEGFLGAANQEPTSRFRQGPTRLSELVIRHPPRRLRSLLGATWIIQKEFAGLVLGGVPRLSGPQRLESTTVLVDDVECVSDFSDPEIKVRDLTGKLMAVERYELRQLIGDELRYTD
jgi:hypothetical protein